MSNCNGYSSNPKPELTPSEREEAMRRSQKARERIEDAGRRPLNPDHDLSWGNQPSFGENEYD